MKTAISIPDETFEQAEKYASALGVSRSEFFTRAAKNYVELLETESLTAQIDAAVELVGADESTQLAAAAGLRRLTQDEDEW